VEESSIDDHYVVLLIQMTTGFSNFFVVREAVFQYGSKDLDRGGSRMLFSSVMATFQEEVDPFEFRRSFDRNDVTRDLDLVEHLHFA